MKIIKLLNLVIIEMLSPKSGTVIENGLQINQTLYENFHSFPEVLHIAPL